MTLALIFQAGEPENVRRPKLNSLVTELNTATTITSNPNIAALAGLTGAADKVPYFTGVGAMALADFTSFGRTLVANANAADARTDLGLGTMATQDANNVAITGGSITNLTALSTADDPYDATTWNGSTSVPTKNAIRDKIETIGGAISGAALTKADDTNVTLTLGGTPATALLAATSITAGWTGQLSAARGGTGIASYAVGDLLYASGATALSKLADVATGNALISGGVTTAPSWGKIGLATHISGTLGAGNGGTGVTSLGDITKADDTNVTLTLGGTPTGALITSTSFTLGWTGRLAYSRFVAATQKSLVGATAAGDFGEITLGSGVAITAGVLSATGTGGTVTSVSGTANEISVATGTTTPVISLPSALTFTGKTVTGGTFDIGGLTATSASITGSINATASGPSDGSTIVFRGSSGGASATTGLRLQDIDDSHTLKLLLGTDLTANRTTTLIPPNANNTLDWSAAGSVTISAFGATLTDDADAATARATLGLVTIASSGSASDLITGTVPAARMPALTGDATTVAGAVAVTFATVNANVGSFGSATKSSTVTVNAKGLVTAASEATITPAFSSITGAPTTLAGYGITDAQPLDSDLTTLAGLTATTDNFIVSVASAWASRTPAQVRTTLALVIGTNVQAYDATLAALASYNTNGILTQTAADTFVGRTLTGTAAEITVTNGDGVSGNPTVSIPTAVTFTGKTITGGTYSAMASIDVTGGATIGGAITATFLGPSSSTIVFRGTNGGATATTGLRLADIDDSHTLRIVVGQDLTANRTLTITPPNANCALDFSAAGNVTITAAGAAILDDADAAAQRTTLGLVIGTNVQAYDADLTTWAGITPGTGVGTALAVNVGSAGAFVTFNGALGTPSSGTLTNATGLPIAGLVASTVTAIGVGTIELGNASDTTIARSGAGDITIEGNAVYRAGGTDVPVADGGTGRSTSTTAYALIAAGTTATGAQQTLAAGATTEILVGGGASALPVWTTATGTGAPARAGSPTFTGTVGAAAITASGLITANGGGVAFPATQVTSSDPNTLDDYEEGTFVPTVAFGGASTGVTYSSHVGAYTKIGRMVYCDIEIILTNKGSSTGAATIGGLPFTVAAAPVSTSGTVLAVSLNTVAVPMASSQAATTSLQLWDYSGGTVTSLNDTDFNNGTWLLFSIAYRV